MQLSLCVAGLALGLISSSCLLSQSRVNQPIPLESVEALEGAASAEAVVELLGAPAEVVELGNRTAYRFEFTRTKETGLFLFVFNLSRTQTKSDRIWCFFDQHEQLTHTGTTLEADSVQHKLW